MNTREEVLASLQTKDKTGVIPAVNELKKDLDETKAAVESFPNFTISTVEPTDADGEDGDIWIIYEEPVGGA